MKIKRYSLYGDPWYENINTPKYILESNTYSFSVKDKNLDIWSKAYFLIYEKDKVDKDLIYITIGNYSIAYIEGTYINCQLSKYEEINKILPFKDFIFVESTIVTNNIKDSYIIETNRFIDKNFSYVTYVSSMFSPINLTPFGIEGIHITFNSAITGTPISSIDRYTIKISDLCFNRDNSSLELKKFKDYKVFYEDRIKQILNRKS